MGGRGWEGHTRGLGVTLQPIGTHGFLSVHSAPGSGRVAQSSSSHGPDLAVPGSNRVSQWEARSMRKKILPPSIKIALSQHCSTSRVWAPRGSSKENIQLKLQRSRNQRHHNHHPLDIHVNGKRTCPHPCIICLGVFGALRITQSTTKCYMSEGTEKLCSQ